jgi:lysophospholipase L1-like esterase
MRWPRLSLAVLLLLTGCRTGKAGSRIAFLGDSITEGWKYPAVNLGIRGNTTAQMLERFPRQVPGHGYTAVVILGGTNDVLTGVPPETTVHNLETLGEETVEDHAQPVLCEIPPIFHDFNPSDRRNFQPAVEDLNRRIAALAARRGWKLVDYYTPLAGHPEDSSDGVHMKRRGYEAMEQALKSQIAATP